MKKIIEFVGQVATLGLFALAASPSIAEDIECPPDAGAITIDGNVVVTSACVLNGTTVKGSVYVYSGGSLSANDVTVIGNVQAENAFEVAVQNSEINGSVQLDNLVGDVSRIAGNTIGGSVQLDSNRTNLEVADNIVNADIQAFSNTGGLTLSSNSIDGNLQCKSNDPGPVGGGNVVQGNAEDQCASLSASGSVGGSSGSGATASGDDVDCPPNLGAVTIDGSVRIAAACEMNGTTVKGNVFLYAGGSLIARDISVDGNIQAQNAFEIDMEASQINGSIQLDGLVGDNSRIVNNAVNGNIQLNDNRSALSVERNTINAEVQAFTNSGGVDVTDNRIDGNLQCKSNSPAPTGSGNQVQGNKEDQCAALVAADSAGSPGTSGSTGPSPSASSAAQGNATSNSSGGGSLGGFEALALLLALLVLSSRRELQRRVN